MSRFLESAIKIGFFKQLFMAGDFVENFLLFLPHYASRFFCISEFEVSKQIYG